MRCADRIDVIQTQFIELGRVLPLLRPIDLVDCVEDRFRRATQQVNQNGIFRMQAGLGISDKQDDIGFIKSKHDLFPRQVLNPGAFRGNVAARIDNGEGFPLPTDSRIVAVPGNAWKVVDQSLISPVHTIEKSRFANIGSTNYCHDSHCFLTFLTAITTGSDP